MKRSINSSSPVLEDNILNRPLDTNSEQEGNRIFAPDFNQITLSENESSNQHYDREEDQINNIAITHGRSVTSNMFNLIEPKPTHVKQKKADV